MEPGNIVNLGVAAAVVATVLLFLRYQLTSQKESRAEREAERETLTNIIVNDLAHVGKGLAKNVETLQEVANGLREVRSALENINGKAGR
ncbi:MAG TPA: hypothetical protein VMY69_03485 [Phycisphaerae bacterium]|nr:hypothetical protein [Phycisphaerae bacterium]